MVVLSPLLVVVVCGIRQSVVLTFPNRLAVGINEFVRRQFAAQFAMPSSIHWAAAKIRKLNCSLEEDIKFILKLGRVYELSFQQKVIKWQCL